MVVFLVVAGLAFLVTWALRQMRPRPKPPGPAASMTAAHLAPYAPAQAGVGGSGGFHFVQTVLALLLLVLIVVLLANVVVMQPHSGLYSAFDLLTGRQVNTALIAGLFGVLLAFWVARVYRSDPATGLSTTTKLEGVVLLILFILGTTSYTVTDLLRGFNVNTAGVTFGLKDTTQVAITSASPAPLAQLSGQQTRSVIPDSASPGSFGAEVIGSLANMMKQDIGYFLIANPQCGPQTVSHKRSATLCKPLLQLIKASKNIESVDDFGACLLQEFGLTQDESHFTSRIKSLTPLVRELHFASKAVEASRPQEDTDSNTQMRAQENVLGGAKSAIENKIGQLADQIHEHIGSFVSIDQKRLPSGVFVELLPGSTLLTVQAPKPFAAVAASAKIAEKKEELSACDKVVRKRPHNRTWPSVPGWPYPIGALPDPDDAPRPYLAILYASLLSIDDQHLAAVAALNEWLWRQSELQPESPRSDLDTAIGSLSPDSIQFWYALRVRAIQTSILHAWYRRTPPGQISPDAYAEYYSMIEEYKRQFDRIPVIADRRASFPKLPTDATGRPWEALGFLREPSTDTCIAWTSNGAPSAPARRLLVAYQTTLAVLARRSLEHKDYSGLVGIASDSLISDLVNTDYSCMKMQYASNESFFYQQYGEVFRVYGLSRIYKVQGKKPVGENYLGWLKRNLQSGQAAFRLARKIIADSVESERKRYRTQSRDARLANINIVWLDDDLKSWIDRTETALQNLEGQTP